MKKTYVILIFTYLFVTLYFAVFNWDVFIVNLDISLGLSTIQIPLIAVLFLAGLILLLFEWAGFKFFSLRMRHDLSAKEGEIARIKADQYDQPLLGNNNDPDALFELNGKLDMIMEKLDIQLNKKTRLDSLSKTLGTDLNSINSADKNK